MKPLQNKWIIADPVQVSKSFLDFAGGSSLVSTTLMRRGITEIAKARPFLFPQFYEPANPFDIPDLEIAVARIESAIHNKERIGIWGDFDVDGQTSTTILVSGLRQLGADTVYYIPVRSKESHGISIASLPNILNQNINLIVTCDTGISGSDAISYAKNLGIDTIVTDHHTLPAILPPAIACVNSLRLPPDHPLYTLCGVGVAYKLIEALFKRAGISKEANKYLDLVCLGTIADMALLVAENRWIVQKGLEIIRTTPRPAIKAILETAKVEESFLSEEHVSFVISPRLNALGRLGDANTIYDFLAAESLTSDVYLMANSLEKMNAERKIHCDQVYNAALSIIKNDNSLLDKPVLVLSHALWPSGILGIVASRLVDTYKIPAILIATPDNEIARGSARSIEGINITEVISDQKDLLLSFGGHPMAAGFSILQNNIEAFSYALFHSVLEKQKSTHVHTLLIDAFINFDDLNLGFVDDINRLAPFGPGNPPLLLATKELLISNFSTIGKTNEHLQITVVEKFSGKEKKVLFWQGAGHTLPDDIFDLAYSIRSSNFRGKHQVQIEWINSRPVDPFTGNLPLFDSKIDITDYRSDPFQQSIFLDLYKNKNFQVWAEGEHDIPEIANNRFQLHSSETLIIYTIPPGVAELNFVLSVVKPKTVYLFSQLFSKDNPIEIRDILFSHIKQVIKTNDGIISIKEFAAKTGHRETTIWAALSGFISAGIIDLTLLDEFQGKLTKGTSIDLEKQRIARTSLVHLVEETKAFRKYFLRADKRHLIT